jgi:hypothetical protein
VFFDPHLLQSGCSLWEAQSWGFLCNPHPSARNFASSSVSLAIR